MLFKKDISGRVMKSHDMVSMAFRGESTLCVYLITVQHFSNCMISLLTRTTKQHLCEEI